MAVDNQTAAMFNYYFQVRQLLQMGISYRDIFDMTQRDINYLIAIEHAINEIQHEDAEKHKLLSR